MRNLARFILAAALVAPIADAGANPGFATAAVNIDRAYLLVLPMADCPLNFTTLDMERRELVIDCRTITGAILYPGWPGYVAPVDATFRGYTVRIRIDGAPRLDIPGCDLFIELPLPIRYAHWEANCRRARISADGFE